MRKFAPLLAVIIVLGGFVAALWSGRTAFERLPDLEDEIAYVFQAKTFAGGQAYIEEPDPQLRLALWQPFVVNCSLADAAVGLDCEDKLFGKYPPGWPLVLALGYLVNAPWVVNPLLFMLTIALVYRLAAEVFDVRVGVLAALLLAISPIAWLHSGSFMSHPWALFCTMLFLYGVWRIECGQRLELFWGAVAGLAAGMLFATRPLAGVSVIVPVGLYLLARVAFAFYQYLPVLLARRRVAVNLVQRLPDLTPLTYILLFSLNAVVLWVGGRVFDTSQPNYPNWTVSVPFFMAAAITVGIALLYGQRRCQRSPATVPLTAQPDPKRRTHLLFLVGGVLLTGAYGSGLLAVVLSGNPAVLQNAFGVFAGWPRTQQVILPMLIALGVSMIVVLFSEGIERRYPERASFLATLSRQNAPYARTFTATLAPLAGLAFFSLVGASFHFAFNYATTGDATQNLYQLIWEYDKVGFGEGHGTARGGHTWERAIRNLNWDTDCYARDLFGWRVLPDTEPARPQLPDNPCAKGTAGLSWVLLPLGVVLGWRRRWLWLLFAVGAAVVFGTMFYWVNASIYSARYYYEATAVLAIVSAVGVVRLADMLRFLRLQYVVYAVFVLVCAYTVVDYAPDRVGKLSGFSAIERTQLDTVDALRTNPDQDVLIISYGPLDSWRSVGALMAVTNPYGNSEYVLVRDPHETRIPLLLERFPGREVIYHHDGMFFQSKAAADSRSAAPTN